MPRPRRAWVSQEVGSFHLISRIVGAEIILHEEEKEYFLKLLERLASGFFVAIHAFCIMGNHFHILATGLELEAGKASKKELYQRYRSMYGKNADPPAGAFESDGSLIPDDDGGVERLRRRLGSISCFVQELKQTFSRWYNKKYDRKGYLWSDRFKGVIVDKDEAQLACSAYIDLNPVRAGIVERPEDYRWCSLGMRVRNPGRSKKLLTLLYILDDNIGGFSQSESSGKRIVTKSLYRYRKFVYLSGGLEKEGEAVTAPTLVDDVVSSHGRIGIEDKFRFRVRNISEGLAVGSHSFIADIQKSFNRKFIRPRAFIGGCGLYTTRVLR
ncbi:MAG: hypothetical protein KAW12_28825, partial [Candidatus Aminicenantes bacterium]|nr:hypothetical protein [Candidatus Aminicenantes bacterium]